jgi:hypothetical protein
VRNPFIIGVIVIAASVLFIAVSRAGKTVDYHRREYVAARDGREAFNVIRGLLNLVSGEVRYQHVSDSDRMVVHRAALIKRGYAEAAIFSVSNQTSHRVVLLLHRANRSGPELEHFGLETYGEDSLRIWAATNDLVKWEQMVRKLDVR